MSQKSNKIKPDKGDVFTQDALPEKIGKNLKQMYDEVLNEPIPDDFLSLLQKADEKHVLK